MYGYQPVAACWATVSSGFNGLILGRFPLEDNGESQRACLLGLGVVIAAFDV